MPKFIPIVIFSFLLASHLFAYDNSECKKNIRNSETFYWVALEEYGLPIYLEKSQKHLNLAKKNCKDKQFTKLILNKQTELDNQFEMASDTTAGLWPVSQFMTRELFQEHKNLKNYVVYDPDVNIAALLSSLDSIQHAFVKNGKFINAATLITSSSFRGGDLNGRRAELESEVIYSLNKSGDYFVITFDELESKVPKRIIEKIYNGTIDTMVFETLNKAFTTDTLFHVHINETDEVEGSFMFNSKGSIYDLRNKKILKEYFGYGFSHNHNSLLERMFYIGLILLFLAILYSFSDYFQITSKLLNHSHTQQLLMTCLFFLLGYIIPNDIIMPSLATLAPDADEILKISWWWPLTTFILCVTMTPAIVRAISSILLSGAKKLSFKLYDDKNYVVLGLGNVFSFITIFLTYNHNAAHITIILVGASITLVYAIMGRYLQSTHDSQILTLVVYFLSIIFTGIAYLSADDLYLTAASIFSLIALLIVRYFEIQSEKKSFTCDLTEEAEFESLFKAFNILKGENAKDHKEFFMQGSNPQDGPVFKIKKALHDESKRWINVIGKSGSGKSLIIHEAVNEYSDESELDQKPFTINARCIENDEELGAFIRAIKQLPDDIYNTAGQESKNTFITKIAGLFVGDALDLAEVSSQDEFELRSNEVLNALIAASATRKIVIIIEDCDLLGSNGLRFLPILADFFIFNKEPKYQKIIQNITFIFGARENKHVLTNGNSADIIVEPPTIEEVSFFLENTFSIEPISAKRIIDYIVQTNDDIDLNVDPKISWKTVVNTLKDLTYEGALKGAGTHIIYETHST